uniref:Uncharacterized protein n=1 Tax=viral metagenome TaxID=1070528 RepID=A0A6H1ZDU0_9ZZZZ
MAYLDLEVKCSECGDALEAEVVYGSRFDVQIIVEPCERCKDAANKEGFEQGLEEGESGRTV